MAPKAFRVELPVGVPMHCLTPFRVYDATDSDTEGKMTPRKNNAKSEEEVDEELDVDLDEEIDEEIDDDLEVVLDEDPDDDVDASEPDPTGEGMERVLPKQADEFVCKSCFLVKSFKQLSDKKRELCRDCV